MKLTSLDRLVQSNRLVIKQVLAKQTTDEELHQEQLRRINDELTQVGHKLDARNWSPKFASSRNRSPQPPNHRLVVQPVSNQSPVTAANGVKTASKLEGSIANDWSKVLPKFKKRPGHRNHSKPAVARPPNNIKTITQGH